MLGGSGARMALKDDELKHYYRMMWLIRRFEEETARAYKARACAAGWPFWARAS